MLPTPERNKPLSSTRRVILTLRLERSQSRRRPRWLGPTVSVGAHDASHPAESFPNGKTTQSRAVACPRQKLCKRKHARTKLGLFAKGTRNGRHNTPQRQESIPKSLFNVHTTRGLVEVVRILPLVPPPRARPQHSQNIACRIGLVGHKTVAGVNQGRCELVCRV